MPTVDRLLDGSSNHTPKKVTSITVSLFTYNDGSLVKSETLSVGEALFTWSAIENISPNMSYLALGSAGASESPSDYFMRSSIQADL